MVPTSLEYSYTPPEEGKQADENKKVILSIVAGIAVAAKTYCVADAGRQGTCEN